MVNIIECKHSPANVVLAFASKQAAPSEFFQAAKMSFFRQVSKKLSNLRQFGGFQSSLVNIWGDPKASKMAGLQGVLLGMGALTYIHLV
jgi:hypothetical protein